MNKNRIIKFRIWDINLKMFLIIKESDSFNLYYFLNRPNDFVVQQFTGLKDNAGKDIYEGDIVTALSSDNKYNSTIKWDNIDGQWGFKSIKCKNMSFSYNLSHGCSKWKIVGNIFETPDLLK